MDFHLDTRSQINFNAMMDYYNSEIHQKELERMGKRLTHVQTYHFKSYEELIDYLKSGKKAWRDTSYSGGSPQYFLYVNGEIEIHTKDGCGDVEWSYNHMSEEEFKNEYFFTLIPYKDYLDYFHKEI